MEKDELKDFPHSGLHQPIWQKSQDRQNVCRRFQDNKPYIDKR